MVFDPNFYPYPSQRRLIFSPRAAVATSQSLATLAGMEMFLAGGNAIDAAIATAIALTLVEPTSNGIGGDAHAIVCVGKQLYGFNGSGKSAANLCLDSLANSEKIPDLGWLTVTVPGAVALWRTLWENCPLHAYLFPRFATLKRAFLCRLSPLQPGKRPKASIFL